MKVFDFKPSPIYIEDSNYNLSDIHYKILSELQIGNLTLSENKYILDKDEFSELRDVILRHVEVFAKQICSFPDEVSFRLTQSWYRETKFGENLPMHDHTNSILSGVYYADVPSGNGHDFLNFFCGDTFFKNFQFCWTPKEYNKYNSQHLQVQVKQGTIILFPSWINHFVTENISKEKTRKIISFNLFVSGTFDLGSNYPTRLSI
jgi:uncharacterized protein (TIGR02466 family)